MLVHSISYKIIKSDSSQNFWLMDSVINTQFTEGNSITMQRNESLLNNTNIPISKHIDRKLVQVRLVNKIFPVYYMIYRTTLHAFASNIFTVMPLYLPIWPPLAIQRVKFLQLAFFLLQ